MAFPFVFIHKDCSFQKIETMAGVRNFFCKLIFCDKIYVFSGQGIRPAPATIYHKNSGMSRAPSGRSLEQLAAKTLDVTVFL